MSFIKIVQVTKSSAKKMSLEVAFEIVESRCLSKFIRYSEFHAAGPAWEKDRSPNFVRIRG